MYINHIQAKIKTTPPTNHPTIFSLSISSTRNDDGSHTHTHGKQDSQPAVSMSMSVCPSVDDDHDDEVDVLVQTTHHCPQLHSLLLCGIHNPSTASIATDSITSSHPGCPTLFIAKFIRTPHIHGAIYVSVYIPQTSRSPQPRCDINMSYKMSWHRNL